jgi:hypothetical protein
MEYVDLEREVQFVIAERLSSFQLGGDLAALASDLDRQFEQLVGHALLGGDDLLPVVALVLGLVSVREGWRVGDEAEPVYGRSDHRDFEGA